MAHTSTHNYLHIVVGTKERASRIPELLQPRLWAYMAGICKNHAMVAFAIGGMEDHVTFAFAIASRPCAGKSHLGRESKFLAMDERAWR